MKLLGTPLSIFILMAHSWGCLAANTTYNAPSAEGHDEASLARLPRTMDQRLARLAREGLWLPEFSAGHTHAGKADLHFYPWILEYGLTDSWTLVWSPFPFEIRRQIHESSFSQSSAAFSLIGIDFHYKHEFAWHPSLEGVYRTRISDHAPDWAIEWRMLAQVDPPEYEDQRMPWNLRLTSALLFQALDHVLLSPWFAVSVERFYSPASYISDAPQRPRAGTTALDRVRLRLPVGFRSQVALSSRVGIELLGIFHRLGHDPGYSAIDTSLKLHILF